MIPESDMPPNPITQLAQAGAALHELFISLTSSGFTERQACWILGSMLANQASGGASA